MKRLIAGAMTLAVAMALSAAPQPSQTGTPGGNPPEHASGKGTGKHSGKPHRGRGSGQHKRKDKTSPAATNPGK